MSRERAPFTGTSTVLRLVVVAVALTAAALYLAKASRAEEVPPREPLAGLPMTFDGWNGRREPDLAPEILAVLGADDYTIRTYARNAATAVGLYIGYHASQRQGDTIHSPMNCLPGSGWEPVSRTYLDIPVAGSAADTITVNRYLIRKGLDEQVVFYWYQSHGRAIANEYRSKVFMVYDAVRLNRTDAALVRIVSPKIGSEKESETRAIDFVRALYPLLGGYIPS